MGKIKCWCFISCRKLCYFKKRMEPDIGYSLNVEVVLVITCRDTGALRLLYYDIKLNFLFVMHLQNSAVLSMEGYYASAI